MPGDGEKMLIGSMLHELLQRSMQAAIAGKLEKSAMVEEVRWLGFASGKLESI